MMSMPVCLAMKMSLVEHFNPKEGDVVVDIGADLWILYDTELKKSWFGWQSSCYRGAI